MVLRSSCHGADVGSMILWWVVDNCKSGKKPDCNYIAFKAELLHSLGEHEVAAYIHIYVYAYIRVYVYIRVDTYTRGRCVLFGHMCIK